VHAVAPQAPAPLPYVPGAMQYKGFFNDLLHLPVTGPSMNTIAVPNDYSFSEVIKDRNELRNRQAIVKQQIALLKQANNTVEKLEARIARDEAIVAANQQTLIDWKDQIKINVQDFSKALDDVVPALSS